MNFNNLKVNFRRLKLINIYLNAINKIVYSYLYLFDPKQVHLIYSYLGLIINRVVNIHFQRPISEAFSLLYFTPAVSVLSHGCRISQVNFLLFFHIEIYTTFFFLEMLRPYSVLLNSFWISIILSRILY